MGLGFHKAHEPLSNLPCFGIAGDHTDSGVGVVRVEVSPDSLEGVIQIISFGHKGEVVLLGGIVGLEVAEEGDWIGRGVPLRSEA